MHSNICTRRGEEVSDDECRVCFVNNAHLRTAFNNRRMRCVDMNLVSIERQPPPPTPHLDAAVERLQDAGYSTDEIIKIAQGMLIMLDTPCADQQTDTSPNKSV